jgi:hypothetical protein
MLGIKTQPKLNVWFIEHSGACISTAATAAPCANGSIDTGATEGRSLCTNNETLLSSGPEPPVLLVEDNILLGESLTTLCINLPTSFRFAPPIRKKIEKNYFKNYFKII